MRFPTRVENARKSEVAPQACKLTPHFRAIEPDASKCRPDDDHGDEFLSDEDDRLDDASVIECLTDDEEAAPLEDTPAPA